MWNIFLFCCGIPLKYFNFPDWFLVKNAQKCATYLMKPSLMAFVVTTILTRQHIKFLTWVYVSNRGSSNSQQRPSINTHYVCLLLIVPAAVYLFLFSHIVLYVLYVQRLHCIESNMTQAIIYAECTCKIYIHGMWRLNCKILLSSSIFRKNRAAFRFCHFLEILCFMLQ